MRLIFVAVSLALLLTLHACGTRSSGKALVPAPSAWTGPVLVTQHALPAGVEYTVLGSVSADARAGYDSAASLHPLLATEARKLGANAVVNATGGRRMTAWSWSAPYTSGTAVKVEDPQKLKGVPGTYH